jgi:beta-galactosidase
MPEGGFVGCDLWADLIHLEGAKPLATYEDNFYAGTPAVTRNVFGEGAAYYLGTRTEERYTVPLLERVCEEAGVRPTVEVPTGVDAVRRKTESASFLFLLNYNEESVGDPATESRPGSPHGDGARSQPGPRPSRSCDTARDNDMRPPRQGGP